MAENNCTFKTTPGHFAVSEDSIDVMALRAALGSDADGAVVTFEGIVRNHNEGKQVRSLFYEACSELAQGEAEAIFQEAEARFGLTRIVCVHRVGALQVGDTAVFVGVSTAHRGESFDGCRFIIDAIKHRLPIWKKEEYLDGSTSWVNCQCREDSP